MTIQEFYSRVGGDYTEVLRRLGSDTRIKKVLGMLPRDSSMSLLQQSLAKKDYSSAFRAAHTLKGIAMNLGLSRLAQADIELTDTLRAGVECEDIWPQYATVKQCYSEATAAIAQLLGDCDG